MVLLYEAYRSIAGNKEANSLPNANKVCVAVIGGDERELILLQALVKSGMNVTAVGYPDLPQLRGVTRVGSVMEAIRNADVVVAPMSNTDDKGVIKAHMDPSVRLVLDEEVFRAMGPGKRLLIGAAKPVIERLAARYGVELVQLADLDEIAILNSIPTAEGAIHRAMTELDVTLHGSEVVVLGFGRCAVTLARMLKGIGSRVRIVARDRGQLARAYEMGFEIGPLSELESYLKDATVVFNTIPARVLGRSQLECIPPGGLIIDIASAPGGTDFKVADELGIRAFLDLGIPGKVAPKTAGQILAQTVPRIILAAYD